MTLFITYLLNLFDFAMTTLWVRLYGITAEANPVGRWMYTNNLTGAVKIVGVGAMLAVIWVCIRIKPKLAWVAYIPLVAYAVLAGYHLIILGGVLI